MQSDTIFAAGFFNGPETDNTHRARIPALDIAPPNRGATAVNFSTGRALDVEQAVFSQVSAVSETVKCIERWYAPLQQPSLIVHEMEFVNLGSVEVEVPLTLKYPVGGVSADLDATTIVDDEQMIVVDGTNKIAARPSTPLTNFSFAANKLPSSVTVPAGKTSDTVYSLIR